MCKILWLLAGGCCGVWNLGAATIQYQVTPLGAGGDYRYSYVVSGIAFQANQDVDIQFPAATSSNLRNGLAGSGFVVNLFQPNNPPGVQGDYSALATVNSPSLAGPFGVDFTYKGTGTPGSQAYTIDQFDANGNFVSVIASGVTTPATVIGTPEPASASLLLLGLAAGGAGWAARRRRNVRA